MDAVASQIDKMIQKGQLTPGLPPGDLPLSNIPCEKNTSKGNPGAAHFQGILKESLETKVLQEDRKTEGPTTGVKELPDNQEFNDLEKTSGEAVLSEIVGWTAAFLVPGLVCVDSAGIEAGEILSETPDEFSNTSSAVKPEIGFQTHNRQTDTMNVSFTNPDERSPGKSMDGLQPEKSWSQPETIKMNEYPESSFQEQGSLERVSSDSFEESGASSSANESPKQLFYGGESTKSNHREQVITGITFPMSASTGALNASEDNKKDFEPSKPHLERISSDANLKVTTLDEYKDTQRLALTGVSVDSLEESLPSLSTNENSNQLYYGGESTKSNHSDSEQENIPGITVPMSASAGALDESEDTQRLALTRERVSKSAGSSQWIQNFDETQSQESINATARNSVSSPTPDKSGTPFLSEQMDKSPSLQKPESYQPKIQSADGRNAPAEIIHSSKEMDSSLNALSLEKEGNADKGLSGLSNQGEDSEGSPDKRVSMNMNSTFEISKSDQRGSHYFPGEYKVSGEMIEEPPKTPSRILMEQIVEGGTQAVQKGGGRVRMSLNPPNLGTLDMEVQVKNNKVEVIFITDNVEIQQSLQAGADLLKTALNQQGLKIDGYSVLIQGNMNASGGYYFGEGSPWRNSREGRNYEGRGSSRGNLADVITEAGMERQSGPVPQQRISLFI